MCFHDLILSLKENLAVLWVSGSAKLNWKSELLGLRVKLPIFLLCAGYRIPDRSTVLQLNKHCLNHVTAQLSSVIT